MPINEKSAEVHFKILNAVTKLEVSKGHLQWKISEVAKEADVTRSLVYYYLGKDKEVILLEAVKYMLERVFNLFEDEPVQIRFRMKIAQEQLNKMPYLLVLYYLNRREDNDIGEIIREGESRLFHLFKKIYPTMSETDTMRLFLLELGTIVYGEVPEKVIDTIFPE